MSLLNKKTAKLLNYILIALGPKTKLFITTYFKKFSIMQNAQKISQQEIAAVKIIPQALWLLKDNSQLQEAKAIAFSKMKLGYKKELLGMAKQMVKGFGISATDIIIGSPYMEVPNPAALLAKTIAEITGATYIRTHRQILHNEPHNEMSLTDRLKLIANDKLELDVKIQLPVVKKH